MSIYLDEKNPGKHKPFDDAAPDIVEYVRYLEVIAGKSANTAFSYYCDLRGFSRFMKRRRIVTPTQQGNLEANRHRHLRLISKRYRVVYYDDSDTLPHNAQVLSEKNVAGRPLKYSAESMAGCDTTIPALGSALSFFSGLPVFFVFPGSAQADASLSYVITSRGGF